MNWTLPTFSEIFSFIDEVFVWPTSDLASTLRLKMNLVPKTAIQLVVTDPSALQTATSTNPPAKWSAIPAGLLNIHEHTQNTKRFSFRSFTVKGLFKRQKNIAKQPVIARRFAGRLQRPYAVLTATSTLAAVRWKSKTAGKIVVTLHWWLFDECDILTCHVSLVCLLTFSIGWLLLTAYLQSPRLWNSYQQLYPTRASHHQLPGRLRQRWTTTNLRFWWQHLRQPVWAPYAQLWVCLPLVCSKRRNFLFLGCLSKGIIDNGFNPTEFLIAPSV